MAVLFLLTKLMGRKQISQLTFFDYIIGISIGSIAAQIAVDRETSFVDGITALIVYALVATVISILTCKSILARRFFTGAPTILVQHGKIVEKNLKKEKFDLNDLLSECRINHIFNFDDIEYAIMEANGRISFLTKSQKRPATPEDLQIAVEQEEPIATVIIDGKVMAENLIKISKSREWLLAELKKQNVSSPKEVFFATCDNNGKLVLHKKNEQTTTKDIFE